jgi:hypothetical protein
MDLSHFTVKKIIDCLISRIEPPNFINSKLGGPGRRIEIDETMLNFKCKSHRGRSPSNHSDAICIIEVNESKFFVFMLPLYQQVCSNVNTYYNVSGGKWFCYLDGRNENVWEVE